VEKHMPSLHEALGIIPHHQKKKKNQKNTAKDLMMSNPQIVLSFNPTILENSQMNIYNYNKIECEICQE
jgi:hypothetical protein